MTTVAVIPARGGSRRLPRKNCLELGGLPLLAYPVRAALESGVFDRVFVSSEDDEIRALARSHGAEVIDRPAALAGDRSTVSEVCVHALEAYPAIELLCCIYATAVLLTPGTLLRSRARLGEEPDVDFLMGVSEFEHPPVQALRVDDDGYLSYMWPDWRGVQAQFQPALVVSNGTFYWARAAALREERTFYGRRLRGYSVPPAEVSDLDTPADLDRLRARIGGGAGGARDAGTVQERFWSDEYAATYIERNRSFDTELGAQAWSRMLGKVSQDVCDYLECGCNIGRNVEQLGVALPVAKASVIEISEPAFRLVTERHALEHAYNGAILEADFEPASFDLVFTMGVLIHIHPERLLEHMACMYRWSRRYVLMGEYFNRTPVSIEYRGKSNLLFKRDFGKLFAESFDVRLVDYGFLWGHVYDDAGFDDITWWLFEKT